MQKKRRPIQKDAPKEVVCAHSIVGRNKVCYTKSGLKWDRYLLLARWECFDGKMDSGQR